MSLEGSLAEEEESVPSYQAAEVPGKSDFDFLTCPQLCPVVLFCKFGKTSLKKTGFVPVPKAPLAKKAYGPRGCTPCRISLSVHCTGDILVAT